MFSQNRLKKLEELTSKLGSGKIQLGTKWAEKMATENHSTPLNEGHDRILRLEEALAGEEVLSSAGKYFRIRQKLKIAWPAAAGIVDLYKRVLIDHGGASMNEESAADIAALLHADPQTITFLDIETCGLAGTSIFLIGWCYFDGDDDFIIEQAFARDYAEEAGIIAATCERLMKTHVLATYNGKRFDFPSICERAIIHRQIVPPLLAHVDLLDQARARWKPLLPNCKLQTVELHLCRRPRHGDIPGSEIPQAYHDFVRTGDARKIKTIIHHNFLDIVTLAEITARLLAGENPEF